MKVNPLELLANSRLNKHHFRILGTTIISFLLEMFDFFIMGFVLAFILGPWQLSYGESSLILLSAGVGTMLGAFACGIWADRWGRRKVMIGSILMFSIFSGFMFFTPEGMWEYVTVFRTLVGFGVGGLTAVLIPYVTEIFPSRHRGTLTGLLQSFTPMGILLGSMSASYLAPIIGWRGLFLICVIPVLLIIPVMRWLPESPRWLFMKGRSEEAILVINRLANEKVDNSQIDHSAMKISSSGSKASLRDLLKYPKSFAISFGINLGTQTAFYGVSLWGPAILAMVLQLKPQEAAAMYMVVSLSGFVGRLFFSFAAERWGRRICGTISGLAGGLLIILVGVFHDRSIGEISVMWLLLIAAQFMMDAALVITGLYTAEVWPSKIRATGFGSAYGFGGLGKIIGPIGLALIAGASNVVSPKATIEAVVPAFTFLGLFLIMVGILFAIAWETKNKNLDELESMLNQTEDRFVKKASEATKG
ncbi:MFS transporter [Brevibacillus nitrificans]|uniref:MFS transporter n=1 Tax=Brevibacillus nitrificans TaxID=651560 RepID=A0A3M8DKJ9_9BACL|nr:MFS transporter [Brevibacillus nitrificans]RNB88610.1 MFS transporter [Brevibacillus nitrificans]